MHQLENFTVTFWVKLSHTQFAMAFFSIANSHSIEEELSIWERFVIFKGSGGSTNLFNPLRPREIGIWYHISLVRDVSDGTLTSYVNADNRSNKPGFNTG